MFIALMFGSIPVKLSYYMWNGSFWGAVPSGSASVPLSAQASPLVQGWATIALVIAPTREFATLAMVLPWKEPSSVILHLIVAVSDLKLIEVKVALKDC